MVQVSVIIPTYNGANKIIHVLRSLEQQDYLAKEIIVVIDGSTDNTVELLQNTKFNLPGFRVVVQKNGGRAKVRNQGALKAEGDLLVFLDDDMIVPKNWLSSHVEHHELIKDTILCGRLEAVILNQKDEFVVFEEWQNFKWNHGITNNQKEVFLLKNPYLTAGNFSIAKSLFLSLGQFDIRLNDAEDYDLAMRAFRANIPIYFSSNAYAYHNDTGLKNFKSYIQRLRQYRTAQKMLVLFKPEIYGIGAENERYPGEAKGLKLRVFSFFANKFWVYVMESGGLKWLPKSMRCKVYDVIITANGVFFPEKVSL